MKTINERLSETKDWFGESGVGYTDEAYRAMPGEIHKLCEALEKACEGLRAYELRGEVVGKSARRTLTEIQAILGGGE